MSIKWPSNFKPKFACVCTANAAAHYINKPHEDYPQRVGHTDAAIHMLIGLMWSHRPINEAVIKLVHTMIMTDLASRGAWRTINVKVGPDVPPPPYMIENILLDWNIFPVGDDIEDWYRRFLIIHPFEDGNGRVAGAVYTATKFVNTEEWHAPCQ